MAGQQDIGALVVTLEAQTAAFEAGMAQATKSLNQFGNVSKTVESQLGGIQGSFLKFNVATAALSTGLNMVTTAFGKLRTFATVREQLDNVQASFKAVLGDGDRAADMIERVMRISNELGTDLPSTANAIRRMTIGLKQLGSTNDEIERVSSTFLKIGAIGGSIEEATAAIFQFSQALGSGTLRGDELISLLERQPLIAQEIAKYLQKIGLSADGSIGSLRKLASEGKVTSVILRDALLDAEERIAEAYNGLPKRISQSLNILKNQLDQFYIELNKEFKINESIGAGLEQLINAVKPALANLSQFIKDVANNVEILQAVALGLGIAFASVLAPAIWAVVKASAAFALTPVGAVITAIAVSIAAVLIYWKELRTAILDTAITLVEYAAIAKEAFGFDSSNLRAMIINLEAAKMEMAELGEKTKEVSKPLTDAEKAALKAAEAAKKFGEAVGKAWESFTEGLQKVRIDTSLTERKIAELERLVSTEKDPRLLRAWTEQLKQLKESLDPVDTELRKFAESIQNTTNPANAAAKELSNLDKALEKGYISWETYGIAVEDAMSKLGGTTMKETKDTIDEIGIAIGNTLSSGVGQLTDAIYDADSSFQEFASNFLISIAKMITQLLILSAIKTSLKGTSIGSFFGFADGGTFRSGTGLEEGVYDSPTVFKFAQGGAFGTRTGVLGEAGPEAILPLKRNASGALGVMAGASTSTTVNVYNNNASATEVSTRESTNMDGSKQIDIIVEQKVKDMFARGSMDKTMRGVYGLSRTPA
jgi:tape measure domain-containing protein